MYRSNRQNQDPQAPPVCSLFWEGDDFFRALLEDIRDAQISIILECYIFQADSTGERVLQGLLDAARRGVRVRLLLDGVGSFPLWTVRRRLGTSTAALRVFKPAGVWTVFRSGFHRRNHRKLILIDDHVAYTGGMNVGDELSMLVRGDRRWRDSMIRVEGGDFVLLKQSFEEIWSHAGKKQFGLMPRSRIKRTELRSLSPLDPNGPEVFFLSNHSSVLRRKQRHLLIQLIKRARNRIYIGSAYFVPARSILWLLRKKANQGVDVQIMTAGRSDVWLARQAGRATYASLLKAGVRIFEFQERMYHSKMTVIDNRVMIGSTNMDYRSFLHNLELDAWIDMPAVCEEAVQRWTMDEAESREIDLPSWRKRGLAEKILEKLAFLIRFYL